MAAEKLVVFRVEPQEGKPDRKVYSVTDEGERVFLTWLGEPVQEDDEDMQRALSKFFFYGMLDRETLLTRLHEILAERRARLQQLQAVTTIAPPRGPYRPLVDSRRMTAMWYMMLDYGRDLTETQIEWLQDVIKTVKNEFV